MTTQGLGAIHAAEAASEGAERSRAEVEVALGNANAEAKKIILQEARDRGEQREQEIVENAKSEAAGMLTTPAPDRPNATRPWPRSAARSST